MKQTIILKFHTVECETGRSVVADAIDLETHDPVASYSLRQLYRRSHALRILVRV